jgi:acetyl esterase
MNHIFLKYLLLAALSSFPPWAFSQSLNEQIKPESRIYKTIGLKRLKLYVFHPSVCKEGERLPAIVFFHGGGFSGGNAANFFPQCRYLADKGIVSISVEYRLKNQHGELPLICITDAKSAIRWVKEHAYELNIDENRIAAGGGSAGGHLAACTALLKDFDEVNENLKISSVPNALVLFNPVLDIPEVLHQLPKRMVNTLKNRETEISPMHHIFTGAPPTIIFHGTADESVPFHQAVKFCDEMKKSGNICEVVPFENLGHGFFRYDYGNINAFFSTMEGTMKFLISIGFLEGVTGLKPAHSTTVNR